MFPLKGTYLNVIVLYPEQTFSSRRKSLENWTEKALHTFFLNGDAQWGAALKNQVSKHAGSGFVRAGSRGQGALCSPRHEVIRASPRGWQRDKIVAFI